MLIVEGKRIRVTDIEKFCSLLRTYEVRNSIVYRYIERGAYVFEEDIQILLVASIEGMAERFNEYDYFDVIDAVEGTGLMIIPLEPSYVNEEEIDEEMNKYLACPRSWHFIEKGETYYVHDIIRDIPKEEYDSLSVGDAYRGGTIKYLTHYPNGPYNVRILRPVVADRQLQLLVSLDESTHSFIECSNKWNDPDDMSWKKDGEYYPDSNVVELL